VLTTVYIKLQCYILRFILLNLLYYK